MFDSALAPDFCAQMVRSFDGMRQYHVPNGRGYKRGFEASAWTELNLSPLADTGFKGFFVQQIDTYLARYNERLGLALVAGRSRRRPPGAGARTGPALVAHRSNRANRRALF